jgi:L-lactate dehydrogenase complex protein LldE
LFIRNFGEFDHIVSPSGSCVLHIREHLRAGGHGRGGGVHSTGGGEAAAKNIRGGIFELVEFLTDVLRIEKIDAKFPHKVGMHQSCHGQRGLKLSQMTELVAPAFSKPERLLNMVQGIEMVALDREDECCGFGGTFCVAEEAVSVKMGKDRIADHLKHGVEYITGSDMSCLMHLEGILRRERSPMKVIHIAEILNGR